MVKKIVVCKIPVTLEVEVSDDDINVCENVDVMINNNLLKFISTNKSKVIDVKIIEN